jgi:hypothetical protein
MEENINEIVKIVKFLKDEMVRKQEIQEIQKIVEEVMQREMGNIRKELEVIYQDLGGITMHDKKEDPRASCAAITEMRTPENTPKIQQEKNLPKEHKEAQDISDSLNDESQNCCNRAKRSSATRNNPKNEDFVVSDYEQPATSSPPKLNKNESSKITDKHQNNEQNGTQNHNKQFDLNMDLPLKTIKSAQEFDLQLNDTDKRKELKKYLRNIGGDNAKESNKKMLTQIFSLDLAKSFSWHGLRDNFIVGNMEIMLVIKETIQETYTDYTDKNFETDGKNWFNGATQKFKLRKQKESEKKEKS